MTMTQSICRLRNRNEWLENNPLENLINNMENKNKLK